MPGGAATLRDVRAAALIALLLGVALVAGCGTGPIDAIQSGGARARPVALLGVLPSPGDLRGPDAAAATADELQVAFTGAPDPTLAERITQRAPSAAAVRTWRDPRGGELVAAVSVWDSHLTATGVGSDLASMLVDQGASAWTPTQVGGSRGARLVQPGRREVRLAYSIGPNSLYVRATGSVSDGTVIKTLNRLIEALPGQTQGLGPAPPRAVPPYANRPGQGRFARLPAPPRGPAHACHQGVRSRRSIRIRAAVVVTRARAARAATSSGPIVPRPRIPGGSR